MKRKELIIRDFIHGNFPGKGSWQKSTGGTFHRLLTRAFAGGVTQALPEGVIDFISRDPHSLMGGVSKALVRSFLESMSTHFLVCPVRNENGGFVFYGELPLYFARPKKGKEESAEATPIEAIKFWLSLVAWPFLFPKVKQKNGDGLLGMTEVPRSCLLKGEDVFVGLFTNKRVVYPTVQFVREQEQRDCHIPCEMCTALSGNTFKYRHGIHGLWLVGEMIQPNVLGKRPILFTPKV